MTAEAKNVVTLVLYRQGPVNGFGVRLLDDSREGIRCRAHICMRAGRNAARFADSRHAQIKHVDINMHDTTNKCSLLRGRGIDVLTACLTSFYADVSTSQRKAHKAHFDAPSSVRCRRFRSLGGRLTFDSASTGPPEDHVLFVGQEPEGEVQR